MAENTIMICAGGTGGHMFPAMALADDLYARGCRVIMVTDSRAQKYCKDSPSVECHVIKSATLPKGVWGKIKGLICLGIGYLQSYQLIGKYKPDLVVGFGGYPSLPTMLVAQRRRLPTVIHEQNAVLGRANAFLAPKADRIALSLPDFSSLEEADAIRAVVTGNPVRSDIATLYASPYMISENEGDFNILVMGGSLGAKIMGQVVPHALASLPPDIRSRVKVVQQCHDEDRDIIANVYKGEGIDADLRPFLNNIAEELSKAHLVIARSGASSVAEVAIAGVPAIYVPYPHHKDQQQKVNANAICDKGGAWMMEEKDFTSAALVARLESLIRSPETLFKAAESARSCAKPEAARKLGNLVIALVKGWDKDALKSFDYTQGLKG